MKTRRVPLRKCIACHQMMPKKAFIRVVRTPEDEIQLDFTGKKAGRGAYLCGKPECVALSQKQHALERALKAKVSAEVYEQLIEAANRFALEHAHE